MSDANSGNVQPEKQDNADVVGDLAEQAASVEPTPEAASAQTAAEGAQAGDATWSDDGGSMAEVTEVVAEAPEPSASSGAVEVTEVVAAEETPGAAEQTEVVAAEATAVYPSAPDATPPAPDATPPAAAATPPAAAAGAAVGAAAAAPGWAAAPPPPPPSYPAAASAPQSAYQSAPPPSYAAAPAASGYGAVTPYQPGPQTSNKAVVAMVMAILSFVVCPVILAIAALIVGGQAKGEIQASNGWLTGDGLVTGAKILAWVNIALSVLGIIFMIIFFAALGNSLNDLQVNIDPSSGFGT